jgi:hypothetical protein
MGDVEMVRKPQNDSARNDCVELAQALAQDSISQRAETPDLEKIDTPKAGVYRGPLCTEFNECGLNPIREHLHTRPAPKKVSSKLQVDATLTITRQHVVSDYRNVHYPSRRRT